jgi:hypothetical protein
MAGFGGMDEEGRGAGRGQRRCDLAPDMARLAEPGDDDPALGLADQSDRFGKRDTERTLQRCNDGGNAVASDFQRAQGRLHGSSVGVVR